MQGGRAGSATLRPKPVDTFPGDKGKEKQQDLIFTGQSLGRKNHPLLAGFGTTPWTGLGREGMARVG